MEMRCQFNSTDIPKLVLAHFQRYIFPAKKNSRVPFDCLAYRARRSQRTSTATLIGELDEI